MRSIKSLIVLHVLHRRLKQLSDSDERLEELLQYLRIQRIPLKGLASTTFYNKCVDHYLEIFKNTPDKAIDCLRMLLAYQEKFLFPYAVGKKPVRSTRELGEGRKIQLFFFNPGRLLCEITQNNRQHLVVTMSLVDYPYFLFRLKGLRTNIVFEEYEDARYIFSPVIRRERRSKDKVHLYLSHTRRRSIIQRRLHLRCTVELAATFQFLSCREELQSEVSTPEYECSIKNISVGGALIECSGMHVSSPCLRVQLRYASICFTARIKKIHHTKDTKKLYLHLQIQEITSIAKMSIQLLVHGFSLS